jgi:ferricrocin synthase
VVRTGRTISVDRIADAICPLVCVMPSRVAFSSGDMEKLIQSAQTSVQNGLQIEPIALGSVTRALGVRDLINVLFSTRNASQPRKSEIIESMSSPAPEPEVSDVVTRAGAGFDVSLVYLCH